jgi:hypothetical protein
LVQPFPEVLVHASSHESALVSGEYPSAPSQWALDLGGLEKARNSASGAPEEPVRHNRDDK